MIQLLVLLAVGDPLASSRPDCRNVADRLASSGYESYRDILQEMLDRKCEDVYPIVAEGLVKGKVPDYTHAAIALALSGKKEYCPLLVTEYFRNLETGESPQIRAAVTLACSNQARPTKIADYQRYLKPAPTLHNECIDRYRTLILKVSNSNMAAAALTLLQETASPDAVDILESYLRSGDDQLRTESVIALQHLELNVSVNLLKKALQDPEPNVRYQAYRILCRFDDPEVEAILKARIPIETDEPSKLLLDKYFGFDAESENR